MSHFQQTRDLAPSFPPLVMNSPTGGYGSPFSSQIQNNYSEKIGELSELAEKILQEPMLQIMLSERIYALMCEDLTYYKERGRSYGGRI